MTEMMDGQISMFDPDLQFGKTFPEHSAPIKARTSGPSSRRSATSKDKGFLFLNLRGWGGSLTGALWEITGVLPGPSSTPVKWGESVSRRGESASTLSQILQLDAPEKYSLSPKACAGILRRAEKRGKVLPDMLRDALMEVVRSDGCCSV